MWRAIAAIATVITALLTMIAAFFTLQATVLRDSDDNPAPPPGIERPPTPDPGIAQPASLEGFWEYGGGSLEVYFDGSEDDLTFYSYDDYDDQGNWIGEGGIIVDVDAREAFMFGYDNFCLEYEADLYFLDGWGMEGDIECLDDGTMGGIGFYR